MRAAIAGTGFIAGVHAIALRAIGVEVVAVAGRTRAGAEAFGTGRAYDDLGELLEHEEVDVLHVCTPNDAHARLALTALERGIHVVCEKPLTVSTEESRALIEAAEERASGIYFRPTDPSCPLCRRFSPALEPPWPPAFDWRHPAARRRPSAGS